MSSGEGSSDDALVAVAAGELVTVGDLALLRHVDADELVDAEGRSSSSSRLKTRTPMTVPARHGEPSATCRAPRGSSRQRSRAAAARSGVSSVSPFGVTLPTRRRRRGPRHRCARCRARRGRRGPRRKTFGMSRVISSAPELGVAGVDLVLLDVDRGERVLFDEALAQG